MSVWKCSLSEFRCECHQNEDRKMLIFKMEQCGWWSVGESWFVFITIAGCFFCFVYPGCWETHGECGKHVLKSDVYSFVCYIYFIPCVCLKPRNSWTSFWCICQGQLICSEKSLLWMRPISYQSPRDSWTTGTLLSQYFIPVSTWLLNRRDIAKPVCFVMWTETM